MAPAQRSTLVQRFARLGLSAVLALAGCDAGDGGTDGGSSIDSGRDAGPDDGGPVDAAPTDGGSTDAATDAATAPSCTDPIPDLAFEEVGSFATPIQLVHAPGSSELFVVERTGRVRRASDGSVFLDVSARINRPPASSSEWGLLSFAFHPDYATNGRFFFGYTPYAVDPDWENRIGEGRATASNPTLGEFVSDILVVDDYAHNHNGGLVMFGPDGMLYAGLGDGGGSGDPMQTGQDLGVLLGKILRLDVSTAGTYAIPSDNPFVGVAGAREEIWAYGLRNPWRFSFDRDTGDLWIGDVGANMREEIDYAPSASGAGDNYGWSAFEGTHMLARPLRAGSVHHAPLLEVTHDDANSIVGGYVYRGSAIPELRGVYLYADSSLDWVRGVRQCDGIVTAGPTPIPGLGMDVPGYGIVSFAEDDAGELYLVYLSGQIQRIVAAAP